MIMSPELCAHSRLPRNAVESPGRTALGSECSKLLSRAGQLDGGAGVTGCFKLSYLHGMKLAMVTRSGGWNPGPQ